MITKNTKNRAAALILTFIITAALGVSSAAAGFIKLATPSPSWSAVSSGVVSWSAVEGANGYSWQLWYGDSYLVDSGYIVSTKTASTYTLNLLNTIKVCPYGSFTVYVQAKADLANPYYITGEFGKTGYLTYSPSGFTIGGSIYQNIKIPGYYYFNYLLYLLYNNTRCTIDIENYNGREGTTKQLNCSVVTPYYPNVEWTSSDESVATVDQNGLVTLVSPGIAIITVTDSHAGSARCTVTVKKAGVIKLN